MERFTRENKALKRTVFVAGAVIVCLLPVCFCLILLLTCFCDICAIFAPVTRTCAMLNSLVNPKRNEKGHISIKNAGRGCRYPVKEGNVKEMVDNLISTHVKFAFAF